ncbi:hypothetical protein [Pyxidicoccus fallax]|uniref:Uncharacterized protein n=1 Tax=Pyxidicoccus fallax TaxID=394095 RepID=A0A848LZY9_9BACT|nr:hypothetical protein [Pyxidicoccus fallax]NMO22883.1 hypothetical protein [Pyxidicoccus fallax]
MSVQGASGHPRVWLEFESGPLAHVQAELRFEFHVERREASSYRPLSLFEQEIPLDEDSEDERQMCAYVTALGADLEAGGFLLGSQGPWLVHAPAWGGSPSYVRLMSHEEWEGRCEGFGREFHDEQVSRIRSVSSELWVCGAPGFVFQRRGSEWSPVETGLPNRHAMVHDVCPFQDALWLLVNQGELWRSAGGRAERVPTPAVPHADGSPNRLNLLSFRDTLYVANGGAQVLAWDGSRFEALRPPGSGPGRDSFCWADIARSGELWLASDERVFVTDGSQWREYDLPALGAPRLYGLCADPAGGAWIAGTASVSGRMRGVLLRATVAGLEQVEVPEAPDIIAQPAMHHGGVYAVGQGAEGGLFQYTPPSVGTSVSLRVSTRTFGSELAALHTLTARVKQLVEAFGGWLES